MNVGQEAAAQAGSASPRARVALLSECGERVCPVEAEYWYGTDTDALRRAVEIGWTYATGGEPQGAEECLKELREFVNFYYDEGDGLLGGAVTVGVRLLEAVLAKSDDEALQAFGRGLNATVDTAKSAEAKANQDARTSPKTQLAGAEERDWQRAALALIRDGKGPVARGMFDSLGPKPPKWLQDLRTRSPP